MLVGGLTRWVAKGEQLQEVALPAGSAEVRRCSSPLPLAHPPRLSISWSASLLYQSKAYMLHPQHNSPFSCCFPFPTFTAPSNSTPSSPPPFSPFPPCRLSISWPTPSLESANPASCLPASCRPPPPNPNSPSQAVRQLADILTFPSVGAKPSGDHQNTTDLPCSHGHEATQQPQEDQGRQTDQPPHPQTDQPPRGTQHPQAIQALHLHTNQNPHPWTTKGTAPQATQHSPVAQYPDVAQLLRSMGEDVAGYEREREAHVQVSTVDGGGRSWGIRGSVRPTYRCVPR